MKKCTILFLLFFCLPCVFLGFGIAKYIYHHPPVEIRDTIYDTGFIYLPEPEPIEVYFPAPPVSIDTAAIIQNYLKTKVYRDTLVNNKYLTAVIQDTVYQNSLSGRKFTYSLSMPELKCEKRPFSLFLAADTRASSSFIVTRNRWLIQGGYDFRNRYPFLGVGFKLY